MADDARIVITSEPSVHPEDVARRSFATTRRGFDPAEVRTFLQKLAAELASARRAERELRARIDELDRRGPVAEKVTVDEETLTNALGEETARVLRSAREAAGEIVAKAEQKVARTVREAQEEASRLRGEAETILARRTDEADAAAAAIRLAAEREAEAVRGAARAEAEAEIETGRARAREMLGEAQAARARVLGDLARRRKLGQVQIEQLRAGRERLLEAYRMVRRTLDEVSDELGRSEAEARAAGEEAGRRAAAEIEATLDELTAELGAADALGLIGDHTGDALTSLDASADAAPTPGPAVAPAPEAAVTPVPIAEEAPPAEPAPEAAAPAPAPEAATVPAGPERKSSYRLLSRSREARAAAPAPPVVAHAAAPITPPVPPPPPAPLPTPGPAPADPPGPAPVEPGPPPIPDEPPQATADEPPETRRSVDELFARMRAEREEAVVSAEAVLQEDDVPASSTSRTERDAAATSEPETAAGAPPEPALEANADEAALHRRDELLEPIDAAAARRMKRALQDEQNEVLDALRKHRGAATVADILPAADDHRLRVAGLAEPLLVQASEAGAIFGGGTPSGAPDVTDLAIDFASELVDRLRDRLESTLAGVTDADDDGPVDRVNAAYREWKQQRVEAAIRHTVTIAFSRGALRAFPAGMMTRWVVDDEGGACPDCDDNALAGPVASGDEFPTGQSHPPAHPGCRCLLIPIRQ
jgi:DivIVA domain-containing protein